MSISFNDLAEQLIEAQHRYDEAKARSNEEYARLNELKQRTIPQAMEEQGIDSITVNTSIGRKQLVRLNQLSVKTVPEMRGHLYDWLREHDAEELITETVNSSTLAAFVREQMRMGERIPDECLILNSYETISIRKA